MRKKLIIMLSLIFTMFLNGCTQNTEKAFVQDVNILNGSIELVSNHGYIKNDSNFLKTSLFWLNQEDILFIMASNIENEDGSRGLNRLVRANIKNGNTILIHEGEDFIPYLGHEQFNWLDESKGLLQIPKYAIYLDLEQNKVDKIDFFEDINFYQIDHTSMNVIFQGAGGIRMGIAGQISNSALIVPDDIPEDFNPDNAHHFNEYNIVPSFSPDGTKTAFLNVIRDMRADKLLIANNQGQILSEYQSANIMNYFWVPNSQYLITEKWNENTLTDIELCRIDTKGDMINQKKFSKTSVNIKHVSNEGVLYEKHDMFSENGINQLVFWSFQDNQEYIILETTQSIVACTFAPDNKSLAAIIGEYMCILDISI